MRYIRLIWVLCMAMMWQLPVACQAQTKTPTTAATDADSRELHTGADVLVRMLNNPAPGEVDHVQSLRDPKVSIAVVGNQSSRVGQTHLVDTLMHLGLHITTIFCPEHGFRGNAEAGATIANGRDPSTGLPIVSLYGKNKKPTTEQMKGIDFVIFDLQDVGCRFYTYISTLHYVMEACADNHAVLIVLDRPNPNCHYVDGPVLDMKYQSFIGMHPVPIVYGLTIGEYARMIAGEQWLKIQDPSYFNPEHDHLFVCRMEGYRRDSSYALPVPPSPNLQTPQSILLYPSLCLFEGTNISVGRGTDTPFEIIGAPQYRTTYMESERGDEPGKSTRFTPRAIKGVSENPPFKGTECRGLDLSKVKMPAKFDLTYLLWMYNHTPKNSFFKNTNGFEKLAGNDQLRKQIQAGLSEEEIRASWEPALSNYKKIRQKYLLYKD